MSAWNRPRLSALLAGFLLLELAACASGPSIRDTYETLPEPPAGKGRIYFYRTATPLFVALRPEIIVNSLMVGRSIHGGAFYKDALPGRYEVFLTSDKETVVTFSIGAGDLRFIKTVIDYGITGAKLQAALVEEATGRQEIAGITLLDAPLTD